MNELHVGRKVSVERSVRYGDEIAGHVIGTATVERVILSENNLTLSLRCPAEWMKYIVHKRFLK